MTTKTLMVYLISYLESLCSRKNLLSTYLKVSCPSPAAFGKHSEFLRQSYDDEQHNNTFLLTIRNFANFEKVSTELKVLFVSLSSTQIFNGQPNMPKNLPDTGASDDLENPVTDTYKG